MEDSSLLRKDNIRASYDKPVLSDDDLAEAFEKVRAKYRKLGIYLPENKMKIDTESLVWKSSAFAKVPADVAFVEIERIKNKHNGLLTAEILLDESRNSNAVFYKCFTWDNDVAADGFRLQQARLILRQITVNVLTDGEQKKVRVYEVVRKEEGKGVYKSIEALTSNDIEYIKSQAVKGLTQYRNKLAVYKEFVVPVKHIDNAISELEIFQAEIR